METNANQKVSCVANYAYDASEADELTVRPGDVLRDVERLPGGWWRGELRGRRGMFPDNFVSVLTEQTNSRPGGVQGRCRAVFSYQPANPDELPLSVGDVLEVLGEVEEGWWQGRRQGRVGVFPSNFVVMLDPVQPAPPFEPAPALPPKPVKELCRVLFPYTAVNDDELTLGEGDVVTVVSKDAPDRGWWRGELNGRVGLFPDNFVQLLPAVAATELEEKRPDRPPSKTPPGGIYPVLNKYSEKTASVKELTTSKISMHKENSVSKESSTQSTITHTSKGESEKLVHIESVNDGTLDGQVKKPPVPLKKSPTPSSGVGGLFSGLKSKMLSTDKEKSSSTNISSGSSSGGEWDRPDGAHASKPAAAATPATAVTAGNALNNNTLDYVERNSILNDPRAGRVKAPRRRPPSQALRDDTPLQIGLSNGHEVSTDKPTERLDKAEEIKPRTRSWEKHRAPWMEELKLNQAKKGSFEVRPRTGEPVGKANSGSTDRILDCGLEEKRSSHSMEMSKSTSSISSRMSVLESYEETKVRQTSDSKKEVTPAHRDDPPSAKPTLHSPTAAGRTLMNMLDEIKKPNAPPPPLAPARPPPEPEKAARTDKLTDVKPTDTVVKAARTDKLTDVKPTDSVVKAARTDKPIETKPTDNVVKAARTEKIADKATDNVVLRVKDKAEPVKPAENIVSRASGIFERTSTLERIEKVEEKIEKPQMNNEKGAHGTVDRLLHSFKIEKTENIEKNDKSEKSEGTEALIAQLNSRISNLEKIIEVQNSMFNAAIADLTSKLKIESEKRQQLQSEMEKLAHCVTQV